MSIVITFPGVTGNTAVAAHTGWIDIYNFNQTITSPTSASGTGSSSGKSELHDFSFSAKEETHCVDIIKNGMSGKHFPTVQVDYIKQTGAGVPEVYKTCIMTEVYITHYTSSRSENQDGIESWNMSAKKAKWEFFKQNTAGGLDSIGDVTVDGASGEIS
jgi:type VI protein secretion system component Hcp